MSYLRPTTTIANHHQRVDAAYAAAGLEKPRRTTEALRAIDAEPTAADIAAEFAHLAYSTDTDPQAFLADAVARIQRAQAIDALRQSLLQRRELIQRGLAPGVVAQAVSDLRPAFDRIVRDLSAAAKKLDAHAPLDVDAAVRDDTTKQLKTARSAVAVFGVFASIHIERPVRDVGRHLAGVLPILELPRCEVEIRAESMSENPPVMNAGECPGTYVVRDLARALEGDTDSALVAVARGDFPGVTLSLADRDQMQERAANASRAMKRRSMTRAQARERVVA